MLPREELVRSLQCGHDRLQPTNGIERVVAVVSPHRRLTSTARIERGASGWSCRNLIQYLLIPSLPCPMSTWHISQRCLQTSISWKYRTLCTSCNFLLLMGQSSLGIVGLSTRGVLRWAGWLFQEGCASMGRWGKREIPPPSPVA